MIYSNQTLPTKSKISKSNPKKIKSLLTQSRSSHFNLHPLTKIQASQYYSNPSDPISHLPSNPIPVTKSKTHPKNASKSQLSHFQTQSILIRHPKTKNLLIKSIQSKYQTILTPPSIQHQF